MMARILALLVTPLLGGCVSLSELAVPSAQRWPLWEAHDPQSTATVDHAEWDRLLAAHVAPGPDGINRVDYGRIGEADRAALRAYIARLAATPVSTLSRPEQMAFWINLYNAATVGLVLDHLPVASILDIKISPGPLPLGPWDKKLVGVEDQALSLNDIEHRILRPIWRDPRVHYAVSCAALGCPDLRRGAYRGAAIETQLTQAAWAFVNHPRGARVEDGRLRVSSIYAWYRIDFGGSDAGVIAHLRQHAEPPLAARLEGVTRIDGHDYDWALNAR